MAPETGQGAWPDYLLLFGGAGMPTNDSSP
jgi:hypothetical protein